MSRWLHIRGRKRSKKDYTKDSSVAWFVALLVLLAAYLVIRTLTANHTSTENENFKEKKIGSTQVSERSVISATPFPERSGE